jgi:hypothetical protein
MWFSVYFLSAGQFRQEQHELREGDQQTGHDQVDDEEGAM